MVNLYLFRSTSVNVTNLPQFCFAKANRNQLYHWCPQPKISYGCLLDADLSDYAYSIAPVDTAQTVRKVNWINNDELVAWLDDQMDKFVSSNRVQTLGNHDPHQLEFLKNRYGAKAMIISVSYTDEMFNWLIDYHVKVHLYKQNLGLIEITETDKQLRENGVDLVEYYSNAFCEQNIIPPSMPPMGDYDFPVDSLLDRSKFFQHLENINAIITDETANYYDTWYLAYEKFFKEQK